MRHGCLKLGTILKCLKILWPHITIIITHIYDLRTLTSPYGCELPKKKLLRDFLDIFNYFHFLEIFFYLKDFCTLLAGVSVPKSISVKMANVVDSAQPAWHVLYFLALMF